MSTFNTASIVTFTINKIRYGVFANQIENILERTPLLPLQNSFNGIKGMLKLKNSYIPVINIQEKLGILTNKENKNTSILIIKYISNNKTMHLGILIDCISGAKKYKTANTIDFPKSELFPMSFFIDKLVKDKDGIIMLINPNHLIESLSSNFNKKSKLFIEAEYTCKENIDRFPKTDVPREEPIEKLSGNPCGNNIPETNQIPVKRKDKAPAEGFFVNDIFGYYIKNIPGTFYRN
jgi:chemotaxis signal transduction protein